MTTNTIPDAVAPKGSGDFKGGHYYGYQNDKWLPLYAPDKDFTLRQARKLQSEGKSAVPSVTTYIGAMSKPQLDTWKQENVAKAAFAALTNAAAQASEEIWTDHCLAVASGASRGAMDLGSRIHKAIEDAVGGQDYDASLDIYVQAVMAERERLGIKESVQEQCIGSTKYGYAGRADDLSAGMTVTDYKSRKSKGKKVASYRESDDLQGASYGYARWGNEFFRTGRLHIFGISTTEPGLVTVHSTEGKDLIPAFEAFLSLTAVWRYTNNFDPRTK